MKDKKAVTKPSVTDELIAKFMSSSAPMESYLQQGNALTDRQLELISLTISGLQTFLDAWKRKRMPKSTSTFLSLYGQTLRKIDHRSPPAGSLEA